MRTSPAVGCSSPAMQRSAVVLPHPEGPSSTSSSPSRTSSVRSWRAAWPAPSNETVRPRRVTDAMAVGYNGEALLPATRRDAMMRIMLAIALASGCEGPFVPPPPPLIPVASVTLNPDVAVIRPDDTLRLQFTLRDTSGQALTGRLPAFSSTDL